MEAWQKQISCFIYYIRWHLASHDSLIICLNNGYCTLLLELWRSGLDLFLVYASGGITAAECGQVDELPWRLGRSSGSLGSGLRRVWLAEEMFFCSSKYTGGAQERSAALIRTRGAEPAALFFTRAFNLFTWDAFISLERAS